MIIKEIALQAYNNSFNQGLLRSSLLIKIVDENEKVGWGEISPLPHYNRETIENVLDQLILKQNEILTINWTIGNCLEKLNELRLYPSLLFGIESALFSILDPLLQFKVSASALFMGSKEEILNQASARYKEGFISAKLKVSGLNFDDAFDVIKQLKDRFHLRVDVNRAWKNEESLYFFSQFPLGSFDYVEEPFQDPLDLKLFLHPLAVDESFPNPLSLEQLESLPTLKALIYKPSVQGGLSGCLNLKNWSIRKKIHLVLSSSFESDLGLACIAAIAHRLSLSLPIGIGTFHFLQDQICAHKIIFSKAFAIIPSEVAPRKNSKNFLTRQSAIGNDKVVKL